GAAYLFSIESYTPGLVADAVNARSITTAQLEDGAVTAAKIGGVLFPSQIPELDLDASKIISGTLADARLSANVALRAGGNAFSGDQTATSGSVGIGTTFPESELHIFRGSYGGPMANPSSLLTLENNNTAIIQMLTPTTNFSGIVFGTPTDFLDASM